MSTVGNAKPRWCSISFSHLPHDTCDGSAAATEAKPVQNLAEAFMHERDRVRDLLAVYRTIPTGAFGAAMLEMALKRADDAMVHGDTVAMLRSYTELKGCQ